MRKLLQSLCPDDLVMDMMMIVVRLNCAEFLNISWDLKPHDNQKQQKSLIANQVKKRRDDDEHPGTGCISKKTKVRCSPIISHSSTQINEFWFWSTCALIFFGFWSNAGTTLLCRIKSTTLVIAIAISSCYNWDQPGMELQNSPRKHKNLNTTTGKALTTGEEREKGSSAAQCQWTIFVMAFTHLAEETLAMGCAIST